MEENEEVGSFVHPRFWKLLRSLSIEPVFSLPHLLGDMASQIGSS